MSYVGELESAFADKVAVSLVNSVIVKDPITKFRNYFTDAKSYLAIYDETIQVETKTEDGGTRQHKKTVPFDLPTAHQVKDDP